MVTFLGQRCSMGRVEVADLMNILLEKLANASERHHVPFEDMLVKLLWVARHEPRDWGES